MAPASCYVALNILRAPGCLPRAIPTGEWHFIPFVASSRSASPFVFLCPLSVAFLFPLHTAFAPCPCCFHVCMPFPFHIRTWICVMQHGFCMCCVLSGSGSMAVKALQFIELFDAGRIKYREVAVPNFLTPTGAFSKGQNVRGRFDDSIRSCDSTRL